LDFQNNEGFAGYSSSEENKQYLADCSRLPSFSKEEENTHIIFFIFSEIVSAGVTFKMGNSFE